MEIQIDTREKPRAIHNILKTFDKNNINYFRSKLLVGDYMNLDNPRLIIDRKQSLIELCGNVCQQHERFKEELIRANKARIKLVLLCEHGQGIRTLEDVYFWQNPRKKASPRATDGDQLYKSLCTIRDRYGADILFCDKKDTGKRIIEILSGE